MVKKPTESKYVIDPDASDVDPDICDAEIANSATDAKYATDTPREI